MQEHDVVAIGNALVDVIAHCDDAFLAAHERTKGSMALIDVPKLAALVMRAAGEVEARMAGVG